MEFVETGIAGVRVADTRQIADSRGSFARWFCEHDLADALGSRRIVQINSSSTVAAGAIRGMHFQNPPHAELKFVRCVRGRVWDVAVDLRAGSSTFCSWHAEELSAENARMLIIPEGCAHGFQVLENDSQLLYLHTAFYAPEAERGVLWNDPRLAITWRLPPSGMSNRDASYPPLDAQFLGLNV